MAVTNEGGLSPQAPPQSQGPSACYQNPQQNHGSPEQNGSFSAPIEKRELLEIAKANAAKTLGTDNVVLPASLKIGTISKESESRKPNEESVKTMNALWQGHWP
uniref:arginine/serine-rich protein 1 isoform X3 n=1 Tax=Podarcis muralis TaxID=64176 RepID=UPI00109FD657|nr:arginine/serine-rich protein 1 isoform X3 [Podarcis muralis]